MTVDLVVEVPPGVLHVFDAPPGHPPSPCFGFGVLVGEFQEGQHGLGNTVGVNGVYPIRVVLGRAVGQEHVLFPKAIPLDDGAVEFVRSQAGGDAFQGYQDKTRMEIVHPAIVWRFAIGPGAIGTLAVDSVTGSSQGRLGQVGFLRVGVDLRQEPGA